MGYSWSHAIFLLVYAAVGFRASCNVPPGTMRCLLIVGTIGNATYHCAMAIICWSSSATALMHQQLDGNPLMRIRVLQLAVFFHTVIFPVTSHFSRSATVVEEHRPPTSAWNAAAKTRRPLVRPRMYVRAQGSE